MNQKNIIASWEYSEQNECCKEYNIVEGLNDIILYLNSTDHDLNKAIENLQMIKEAIESDKKKEKRNIDLMIEQR